MQIILSNMKDFKSLGIDYSDGNEANKCYYHIRLDTYGCGCAENFGFAFFAFGGIYSAGECVSIAVASTLVEIIVGICDTPFLYLARKMKNEA